MIIKATKGHRADLYYVAAQAEHYQKGRSTDAQKIEEMINLWFSEPDDKSVILLAYEDMPGVGAPVGCLAARIEPHIWHKGDVAVECLWWIDRQHPQQTRHLLGAFEYWAKMCGASEVLLTAAVTDDVDRISKVYARKGYKETERAFFKEIR